MRSAASDVDDYLADVPRHVLIERFEPDGSVESLRRPALIRLCPADVRPRQERLRRVAVVGAVVAATLFIVGPVVTNTDGREPDTVDERRTEQLSVSVDDDSTSIGNAIVRALNVGDRTTVRRLLRHDAVVVVSTATDAGEFEQLAEWFDVTGSRFDNRGCWFAEPNQVICPVLQHNAWSDAVGADPVHGEFSISVGGGSITSIRYTSDLARWTDAVVDPFLHFVKAEHFSDINTMWFLERGRIIGPRLTDRSIDTFARHTLEYSRWAEPPDSATRSGDALLQALNDVDLPAARALLHDDAIVVVFGSTDAAGLERLLRWFEVTGLYFGNRGCVYALPNQVNCSVLQGNSWSQALGVDPIEGTFSMSLTGGSISSISYTKDRATWTRSVVEPFVRFVEATGPEPAVMMWQRADGEVADPVLSDDAIALFEHFTIAFAALSDTDRTTTN